MLTFRTGVPLLSLLVVMLSLGVPAPGQRIINDKTLVAWVTLANLTQRGGSVLTLYDPASQFDGIVFGELSPGKWMAGSDLFHRTEQNQKSYPDEKADSHTLVQMAIVYQGNDVRMYRDGALTMQYHIDQPHSFPEDSAIVMGLRHPGAGSPSHFAGSIEDARIYTVALTPEQIAALRPNKPSQPKPLSWWTFDGGKAVDRMGKFTAELVGGATVTNGRLLLNGADASLIAMETEPMKDASPIHFRPRLGVFADPIPFSWKGEHHIFYLRGDIGKVPWEHIVSQDLVHWKELPAALVSDGAPNGPDGGNMFTGSAVQGEGQFHIFYTGDNGSNPQGTEFIMHATSTDLIHWTKHPEDMIAPDGVHYKNAPARDFRDPYVFWNTIEKTYWMVFFANDAHTGAGVQGLATSKDLKHWEFQPPLDGAGGQECPDLFQIGDTWYLIGGDHYSIAKDPRGPYTAPQISNVIDRPFVYAAKRTFDGKRNIWTGWLWDRSPRNDNGSPTWGGTQCLPRELYPGPGGQLYCRPAAEVSTVFTQTVLDLARKPAIVTDASHWEYTPTGLAGHGNAGSASCALAVPDNYMLQCKLQMDPGAVFTLTLRQTDQSASGYHLILRPAKQEAEISSPAFHEPRHITLDASHPITIQAFVQGSMIETFINDQYAFSCRAYDFPSGHLGLEVSGGDAKVLALHVKVHDTKQH